MLDSYGSYRVDGPRFSVIELRGPIRHRQELASKHAVHAYFEQHLNATTIKPSPNYGFVIVPQSAPKQAERLARSYLASVSKKFQVQNHGIVKGGRGSGNLLRVAWPIPALLLEPLFYSHDDTAEWLQTPQGREDLASCIVDACKAEFKRGLFGLSAGHAWKNGKLYDDPGALAPKQDASEPDWDPKFDTEGELNAEIVRLAVELLVKCE